MIDRRSILVFVKVPEREPVKSRLSRELDAGFVRALYECMVRDALDTVGSTDIPYRICFAPPDALTEAQAWLGHERLYMCQTGNDLGERMERAFGSVFSDGADRAILMGSDIPGITGAIIRDAFDILESHDAVIGPANDGGYYLVGFTRTGFSPEIFRDMLWSTATVFTETLNRLLAVTRSYRVLPECIDADTKQDLVRLLELSEGAVHDTRTLALLRRNREFIR